MAQAFNLTAQLQLQAPTNTGRVVSQIRKSLGDLKVNVKIQGDAKSLSTVQNQLKNVDKSARSSAKGMNQLNKNIAEAARRFSVITIATGSMIALSRAIKNSVGAAIEFERELVKISQVTGKSIGNLKGLSAEVTRLSSTLGVSNQSLLETARILAQAGYSAIKTKQALEVLANTTLAPSFDNIIDTTEGAIAVVNQFGREAKQTGNDIQFLEASLDAINQVSKTFAVESKDLITAVRRTGGVFEAAGGKLNELIALFTAVRQTTRESAETIATGFRTIFTRLQRGETIEALEDLGIKLSDLDGKFIGPMKAIEALANGLAGLDPKDVRFNEIVEQLGGFRQIGKVIPLIKQYAVAENALSVANNSLGSSSKDAQTAQQSLAVQFMKVREQFDALMRKFVDSSSFRSMAGTVLELAESFIKFAGALEEILPMLISLAAIKIGRAIAPGVKGLMGGKQHGGKVSGFAGGGWVPGRGNRDTVPAMLTPGEFVIKKSSAKKLGGQQLEAMNSPQRFKDGGGVKEEKVPKLVSAAGPTQGSHIGADLRLTKKRYDAAMAQATIKFKRSFVANAVWGGQAKMSDEEKATLQDDEAVRKLFKKNIGLNHKQVIKSMGLTAKTPLKLNYPKSYNQALRTGNIDLVDRAEMSAWTGMASNLFGGKKGLPQKLQADPGFQASIKPIQAGLATAITGLAGSAVGKAGTPGSAFDHDNELQPLKKHLVAALGGVAPKALAAMMNTADFMFSGSGWVTKGGDRRTSGDRDENRKLALGGLVQRFAMGGLATQKSVGAAILDPDTEQIDDTVKVTVDELNKKFPAFKNLKKGASPVSSLYKATDFKVIRQGLSQDTSTKFQNALNEGLVAGTDLATATLAKDLGTSSKPIDAGSKKNFVSTVRPAIRGDLFEAALLSMNNAGTFDSKQDPNRPFDFPSGLQGGLKDNYASLPANWVDAKSSYAAASTASMKGKIVRQLVGDLKSSGIESMGINKGGKKAAKSADGTTTAAKGGSISGSTDSVPSLLTPGEFVINKSAAQSIGYSNLSRMNDTGVSRFAAGGLVGIQRFAGGGGVGPGNTMQADLSQFATQAPKAAAAISQFTNSVAMAHSAMLTYQGAITRGSTEGEALNAASNYVENALNTLGSSYSTAITTNQNLTQWQDDLSGEAQLLSQELQHESDAAKQTAAINEKYIALRKKGMPAVEARRKAVEEQIKIDGTLLLMKKKLHTSLSNQSKGGGPGGGPPGGGGGGLGGQMKQMGAAIKPHLNMKTAQKGLDLMGRAAGKMQSVLSRVSSGLIGLSFVAGMVVEQMGGLTDAEKEQHQAAIAGVSAYAAVAAEVLSFTMQLGIGILNMVSQAAMTAMMIPAKAAEIAATLASAGSEGVETAANVAAVAAEGAETGINVGAVVAEAAEIKANALASAAELADLAATIITTAATVLLGAAAVIATVGVLALGVGAVVATVGVLALGVAAVVAAVGVLALGVGAVVAAAGMIVLGAGALIAGVAFAAVAVTAALAAVAAATLAVTVVLASAALVVLSAGALLAGATLLIAGAAAIVASAALLVVGVAAAAAAVTVLILAVAATVAAVTITALAATAAIAAVMVAALAVSATVASVSMILMATTSVVATVGVALLGVSSMVAAVGVTLLSVTSAVAGVAVGALGVISVVATVAIGLLAVASVLASVSVTALASTSLVAGVGVLLLGTSSVIGAAGVLALGVASLGAAAGLAFFAGALLGGGLFTAIATIGAALIGLTVSVMGVIAAAAAEIAASIAVAATKIGEVIASAAATIASGLETIASGIVSAAKTVEGLASTAVAAIKSIEVMATLTSVSATIMETLSTFGSAAAKTVETAISGALTAVKTSEVAATLANVAADLSAFASKMLGVLADLKSVAASFLLDAAKAAEGLASAVVSAAKAAEGIASSVLSGLKAVEGAAGSALAAIKSVEVAETLANVAAMGMELLSTLANTMSKWAEAAAGSTLVTSKLAEVGAAISRIAVSAMELVSGWAKIAMEAIQNSTIVTLIATKMTEIATTIGAIATKVAEVAATVVAMVVTVAKAVAEAFGAAMAILAAGGSLAQAGAAFMAALGLGGVGVAAAPAAAGLGTVAIVCIPLVIALVALAAIVMVVVAALLLFAVGYGVGFATSMYQTIKASTALKQSMERLTKAGDAQIESLRETGGGSESEFVDNRSGAAVAEFNKSLLDTKKFTLAHAQGMKTGADTLKETAKTVAVMWALNLIPVVGQIAALGYGAYKVVDSFSSVDGVISEAVRAQQALIASEQAQAAKIAKISNLYATTTWRATKAVIDFDKSLKDAKEAGLNAADTFDIMAGGMAGMLQQADAGEGRLEESDTRKKELQADLEIKGLVSGTGSVIGEGETGAEKSALAEYKVLTDQESEARKAHNDLLNKIFKQEAALRRGVQNAFGEVIADLASGAGGADLTDVTSFDDLKAQGGMGDRVKKAMEEIDKIIELEFADAIKEAKKVGDRDLVAGLEAKKGARKDVAQAQIKEAAMSRLLAEQKANAAILNTEMTERAKQRAIDQVNTTLKGFNNALLGATATADAMAAIDPAIAIANNEGPEAAMFDTDALEQPFSQINPDILNEALEQGVAGITLGIGTNPFGGGAAADVEIEERAKDIETKIKTVQSTIAAIPASMLASQTAMKIPKDTKGQNELSAKLFKDLDDSVGNALSADLQLGPMVEGKIKEMVEEGKPITTDMLGDLIGDLEGVGEAQLEAIKRSIEVQNKFLSSMDKINTAIIAQQQKFANALAKVTEVTQRGSDRMANARAGGRVETSNDIRRNRQTRETRRGTAASQMLGPDARGAGAIGGDVAATATALKKLQDEATANATAARNETDPLAKAKFSENAKRAAQGAKNAAAELERLSDQSARAADIEKELNQVRKGRKQIGAQVERFAFGSDDERTKQSEQFGDLKLAIGQGGIQGANEDQRANVGSMLDALSDVENVGNTGKTGRQLKAEFAEKEAIQQGLPPEIAKQLGQAAAAGPREEALLNELAALGREEKEAAVAIAKNADQQLSALQAIRDKLGTNFVIDINAGQQQAAAQDKSPAKAANDKALKDANDAAVTAVNDTAAAWEAADTELKNFQGALKDTIKVLAELEKPDVQAARRGDITGAREAQFTGSDEELSTQRIGGLIQNFGNAGDDEESFFKAIAVSQNVEGGGMAGGDAIRNQRNMNFGDGSVQDDIIMREGAWGGNSSIAEFGTYNMPETATGEEAAEINTDRIRAALEASLASTFMASNQAVDTTAADGGAAAFDTLQTAQMAVLDNLVKKVQEIQKGATIDGVDASAEFSALGPVIAASMSSIFLPAMTAAMKDQAAGGPLGLARGGMVYRAGGGSIFQPKGTDTVPAMLTPGEFVIRKSAVDKIGAGNLAAMNNGMSTGGVVYRAGGGPIGVPTAGVFGKSFVSEIAGNKKGGNAPLIEALSAGYGLSKNNAVTALRNLKFLSKKGNLKPESINGPSQLDAMMDILRQEGSSVIQSTFTGGDPNTIFKLPDFGSGLDGLDLGWIADEAGVRRRSPEAMTAVGQMMADMGHYEASLKKLFEMSKKHIDSSSMVEGSRFFKSLGLVDKDINESSAKTVEATIKEYGVALGERIMLGVNYKSSNERGNRYTPEAMAAMAGNNIAFEPALGAPAGDGKGILKSVDGPTRKAEESWGLVTAQLRELQGQRENQVGVAEAAQAAAAQAAAAKNGAKKKEPEPKKVDAGENRAQEWLKTNGILTMATGGSVSSVLDKVPAMLTPGEFVMSPESVQKHGVGFMKRLNSGRAPGFRRGGLVGSGVAYRAAGSTGAEGGGGGMTLSLDSSNIQGVLDNFNATFASTLDNVIVQFSQISAGLDKLAGAMQNGMVMTHNFTGDLALAFKIENADVLKKTIADAITPKLSEIITTEIDKRLNKDFKAGS